MIISSRGLIAPVKKPAGGGTTTLNPSDASADLSFSNGNLTVTTGGAGGAFDTVRSIASHSSGKFYYEFTVSNVSSFAIGTSNSSLATNDWTGNTLNACGWSANAIFLNSTQLGAAVDNTIANSQCAIAIDLGAKLFWERIGSGNWNNSPTANPATGVEGRDFSTINAGPYFASFTVAGNTAGIILTVNFGASSYAQTPPSGFGNW